MDKQRTYFAIDLKSFFASVECRERGLDPLNTNLVVADIGRTEKTVCLAVSPSLKGYGIGGRARLYEVVSKVNSANDFRRKKLGGKDFSGESYIDSELKNDPNLKISYIVAPPRMSYYLKYSGEIYNVYLKYFAHEDIHTYSIDEVFIDATNYLGIYKLTPRELLVKVMKDVLETTGITATAGIGTNMYLAKVAMDIEAKHMPPDSNGARIAELDEMSYRRKLWNHRPLTDFWRVGGATARNLEKKHIFTMGDVARCSVGKPDEYYNEELLYKMFGINAELLIDHAWGWEPCTIKDIREYKPENKSISSGQVLHFPYDWDKTRIVVREMADSLSLELVEKNLTTDSIVLTIGYDIENIKDISRRSAYSGEIVTDGYGRKVPKSSHGTVRLERRTSSSNIVIDGALRLFDDITDKNLLVRRINIVANNVCPREDGGAEQLDMFSLMDDTQSEKDEKLRREENIQRAIISLKKKYGKNSVVKGTNLKKGATGMQRNDQIGGHKA